MDSARYLRIKNKNIFTIFSDSEKKNVVICCHGFRGDTTGPNRLFVRLARKLEEKGISSLRFDQYGCGNSEGKFEDSSFNNWVETIINLAQKYIKSGYQVALMGQSMGGSGVIVAGSKLKDSISSIVAWTPGVMAQKPKTRGKYMYESSQRVRWEYWIEAHSANIPECFKKLTVNTLVFFATKDEYVSLKDQKIIIKSVKPNQRIEILENEVHSKWSYEVSEKVIEKTANFFVSNFK